MNNIKLLQIKLKSKKEYLIGIIEDYDNAIEFLPNYRLAYHMSCVSENISRLREKREFFKGQLTIIKQILKTDKNYE